MRRLPELKAEFFHDDNISDEDLIKRVDEMYNILCKETVKMMEESTDPAHKAFLEKYPYLRERPVLRDREI